jgi:hypothetical protein
MTHHPLHAIFSLGGRMRPTPETSIFDGDKFHWEASNILGALVNLNYLVCEEADNARQSSPLRKHD